MTRVQQALKVLLVLTESPALPDRVVIRARPVLRAQPVSMGSPESPVCRGHRGLPAPPVHRALLA